MLNTGPTSAPADKRRYPRWLDRSICIAIVVASVLFGSVHVFQHSGVSPIDEYVYIDYLAKVPTQGIVRRGEEVGQFAREYLVCHGVRAVGAYPASFCADHVGSVAQEKRLPNAGETTADIYTPLYFVVTWAVAQPLTWLGANLVTAGRLVGAIWLAAAGVLLYLALRRLKIGPLLSSGLALLVVGSLPAYWSNTYISTDATGLFSGSLLLFLWAAGFATRRHGLWLVLASALVTLLKVQNFLPVAVIALVLLCQALTSLFGQRKTRERSVLGDLVREARVQVALLMVVVPIICQVVWLMIRNAIALGPSPDQGVGAPFGKTALLGEVLKMLPHAMDGAITTNQVLLGFVGTASSLLLAAAVVGLSLAARPCSPRSLFATSTLLVALLAGPALAFLSYVTSGYYFLLPSRYSIALVPMYVGCLALLVSRRAPTSAVVAAGGFTAFAVVLLLPQIA